MEVQCVLYEKIPTRNGIWCLISDGGVHFGDSGVPLVCASEGQMVGVVGGRLEPAAFGGVEAQTVLRPTLSDAISMVYGDRLLQARGVPL